MYYLHNGAVYGTLLDAGRIVCCKLSVRDSDCGVKLTREGDSLPSVPRGAIPMTYAEVVARAPRSTGQTDAPKPKKSAKR